MNSRATSACLKDSKFHGKEVYHWQRRLESDDLTGDLDADYISRTWSIYENIAELTREPKVYQSTPLEKLKGYQLDGDSFLWGVPKDDLVRGLLWHAVYKPFWNENAKHSGPTWSWASLSQRVGWPDYSSGKLKDDLVHVEDVAIGDLSSDKAAAQLSLTGDVVLTNFELYNGTERKGSLAGSNIEKILSCTMDCNFSKREVCVVKMLTRCLEGGMFCTHFLVLEPIPFDKGKDDIANDDIGSLVIDKADKLFCRRVGTAKLNHRAVDAHELRRPQRVNVVIV